MKYLLTALLLVSSTAAFAGQHCRQDAEFIAARTEADNLVHTAIMREPDSLEKLKLGKIKMLVLQSCFVDAPTSQTFCQESGQFAYTLGNSKRPVYVCPTNVSAQTRHNMLVNKIIATSILAAITDNTAVAKSYMQKIKSLNAN